MDLSLVIVGVVLAFYLWNYFWNINPHFFDNMNEGPSLLSFMYEDSPPNENENPVLTIPTADGNDPTGLDPVDDPVSFAMMQDLGEF